MPPSWKKAILKVAGHVLLAAWDFDDVALGTHVLTFKWLSR